MTRAKRQPAAARRSSMPPLNREVQLRCPIALFEQVEPKIRSLTTLIDSTHDLQNRAEFAQSLLAQCEKLLHCESFDETNMNCRLCHHISGLRQKTAELVLKVAQSPRFEEREA